VARGDSGVPLVEGRNQSRHVNGTIDQYPPALASPWVCFSPQADLVGGTVIAAIGIGVIRSARKRHSQIALATLPLVLGTHQIIEAFVWLGLQGHVPHGLERFALWAYLLIAFVLLPIYVPLAVLIDEPVHRRRWMMAPLVGLGAAVASDLFVALVHGPVNVRLRPYHLAYSIDLGHGAVVVVLYVIAICGTLLLSTRRRVVTFGAVNVVAVAVIAWLTVDGFASVWCGWAALSSGAIALHVHASRIRRLLPLVPSTS
jgi:hypothetical protein